MRRIVIGGLLGSVLSTAALVVAARAEGKAAVRPINATSHWLHGDAAGAVERVDLAHTAIGFATHLAATSFWAGFVAWCAWARPGRGLRARTERAITVAVVAAAIDYGATPKRFTPGWELVLRRRSMVSAYAAMALGLVLALPA